jgi:hypothetical protein
MRAIRLHGVLGGPLPGRTIVSRLVRLQQLGNIGDKRVFGIGIGQQRANGQQYLANGQCWTPLVLQNVEANTTIGIDVAVINTSREMDLGRLQIED